MRSARLAGDRLLAVLVGGLAGALAAFNVRAALALLAAAAVAVLMLVGAEVLLLGVVAVEPWNDALNFPTSTVTIPKLVGVLAVASWALAAATGRARLRFTPQMGWAFVFLLTVVVSLMLSPDPGAGAQKTISYALYIMFLGLFVQSIHSRQMARRCLGVYTGSAILAAADGLLRFAGGQVHLASGPVSDPNDFALILAGAIPLTAYFAGYSERGRWAWRVGFLVIVAGALATFSRGALVGFAAVLIWAILSGRISLPSLLAGALAIMIGLAVGIGFFGSLLQERLTQKSAIANTNVVSREAFWVAAVHMAEDHPLFGVGPARFGAESVHYVVNDPIVLTNPVTHNSYLEILAEDGIFAIALFAAFMVSTWRALRRARAMALEHEQVRDVRLVDALMASFLWTAVSMIFVSYQLSIPLWLIGGLAGSLVLSETTGLAPGAGPGGRTGDRSAPQLPRRSASQQVA